MTTETLLFIRELLERMTIAVKDPEFPRLATRMIQALEEIDAAIAEQETPT